jgi:photosystem II stability/assembly factor-like uncharacterized protein
MVKKNLLTTIATLFLLFGCSTESTEIYSLNTNPSPVDGGTVSPALGEYDDGTEVQITASANEHWVFAGWQGDQTGSGNPVTVIMDRDKSITALFREREYTLTMETEGSGTIKEEIVATKTADFPHGTVVRLTAIPDEGWSFIEWQDDLSGSENPTEITIEGESSVTALFEENPVNELEITVSNTGMGQFYNAIDFVDSDYGWVGADGYLLATTDGGDTWSIQMEEVNVYSLTFLNREVGYASVFSFGEEDVRGVYKTTNGGAEWSQVFQNENSINALFFFDEETGWAAGRNDLIAHTSDGGVTWEVQDNFEDTFEGPNLSFWIMDLWFADDENGWGVGQYFPADNTLIIRTENGGDTWSVVNSNMGNRMENIHFLSDENTAWITLANAFLYKYDDSDGSTVTGYIHETSASFRDIAFVNDNHGFAVGSMDFVLETRNSGESWSEIALDESYVLVEMVIVENTLFAIGNGGVFLKMEF